MVDGVLLLAKLAVTRNAPSRHLPGCRWRPPSSGRRSRIVACANIHSSGSKQQAHDARRRSQVTTEQN